jgi:ClpP class serine protease
MRQLIRLLQTAPLFAIREDVGMNLRAVAESILNGDRSASFDLQNDRAARADEMSSEAYVASPKGEQRVAVIPIHGVMLAEDQVCGPAGMLTLAQEMYRLADSKAISAVVMDQFSPGGQVAGLQELLNAADYVRSKKPLIAYVNSMAASAAYWLASRADSIILNGPAAEVGSVGVMLHYLDFTEALNKKGVREIKVVSNLSPEKNSINMSNPSDDDMMLMATEMLDPLAGIFMAEISAARPGIDPAALRGKTFLADRAIELGMADAIGTINDAIQMAAELATQPATGGRNSNYMSKPQSFAGRLLGIFGSADNAPETPETPDLNGDESTDSPDDLAEELDEVETDDLASDVDALLGTVQDLTARLDALEKTATSLVNKVEVLVSKVELIAKSASAERPAPVANGDFVPTAPTANKPWSNIGPKLPN